LHQRISGLRALVTACAVVLAAPGAARALPILSEVLYDAVGSDDGSVFVEIFGVPGTVLDGLVVEGVNGSGGSVTTSVALVGTIPADGFFVVADTTGGGTTFVPEADQLASFDFQNGPDSVVLRSDASVLDALGYGSFDPGDAFAGEGTPAPDAAAGESLARTFADVDTGDNGADFTVLAVPTPGAGSLAEVPEPALAALLSGVLWIVRRPRRHGPAAPHRP